MFQLMSQLNIQARLLLVILCLHIKLNKEVLPLLEKKLDTYQTRHTLILAELLKQCNPGLQVWEPFH